MLGSMKLVHKEILIDDVPTPAAKAVGQARAAIRAAVASIQWPPNSGAFTIHAESGKKRGQGNGVVPIKKAFAAELCKSNAWLAEQRIAIKTPHMPGKVDAILTTPHGQYCVEWETGNISSCHRSLNKLSLGLMKGNIVAATVLVPSRALYAYLTDRVGNYDELKPYLEFWKAACRGAKGFLSVIVVEHDATSKTVPRIPKGTDGRAVA